MKELIFFMPKEIVDVWLEKLPYGEYHKINVHRSYDSLLKYIEDNNYFVKEDILAIEKDSLDDIVKGFLDSKSSPTYRNLVRCCLKCIFYIHNIQFDLSKYVINDCYGYKDVKNNFLTEEDFMLELNNLFNYSDKLLSYMAFKNLLGYKFINVRMAKVSDIDFENGFWRLYDGRVVHFKDFDNILVELLNGTVNQKGYVPYDKKDKISVDGLYMPDMYKYNLNSECLFKTRNHPRSGDGLNAFSEVGVNQTFKRMSDYFGKVFNKNNLKLSGFLASMYAKDPTPTWTIQRINAHKKELGCTATSQNIRKYYLGMYFGGLENYS